MQLVRPVNRCERAPDVSLHVRSCGLVCWPRLANMPASRNEDMNDMSGASIMLLALAFDAILGWPQAVHARIGHPVTWIGAMIAAMDRRFNREADSDATRRGAGLGLSLIHI